MPNWCFNSLTASKEILDAHIVDGELDFNKAVPMPAHQPDRNKPNPFFAEGGLSSQEERLYGDQNWYHWSIKHWGTKWNATETTRTADNQIDFQTAWSPPMPWLLELSKQHPKEKFVMFCDEEGAYFRFEVTVQNGNVLKEIDLTWMLQHRSCPKCEDGYGIEEEIDSDYSSTTYHCSDCDTSWKVTPEGVEIL